MPELMGGTGVLIDPLDVDAWAQAIVEIIEHQERRESIVAAGLRRAAEFSWTRTASETLAVLREAAAE
jgi:glycosyltransferase involved in cell wall biosynthesis